MSMLKFDVVIPSYRRIDELKRAVSSVLRQGDYVGIIVIVDDASPNQTDIQKMLSVFSDSRIIFVANQEKSNAAATRNQGVTYCNNEWIAFLDSDDEFCAGKFEAIAKEIVVYPQTDVFYNKAMIYFNDDPEKSVPTRPKNNNEKIGDFLFVSNEIMQTSTLVVNRRLLVQPGFNPTYIRHQDYDFCLALEERGGVFGLVNHIGTVIYWNATERPHNKGESVAYSEKWLIENKHRLSFEAQKGFYVNFVLMKAARLGLRWQAVRYVASQRYSVNSPKLLLKLAFILMLPNAVYFKLFVLKKKLKIKPSS